MNVRPPLLICLIALAVHAPAPARAGLAWFDGSEAGGQLSVFFPCDSTQGADELIVTITPSESIGVITAVYFGMTVVAKGDSVPDWWKVGMGGSRSAQVLTGFDNPPFDDGILENPWDAVYAGIVAFVPDLEGCANCGHIDGAIEEATTRPLRKGDRYYLFRLRLARNRATGADSIAGCSAPVCLEFRYLSLVKADGSIAREFVSPGRVGWQMWCSPYAEAERVQPLFHPGSRPAVPASR
jgi:hypothetical protein